MTQHPRFATKSEQQAQATWSSKDSEISPENAAKERVRFRDHIWHEVIISQWNTLENLKF